MNNELKGVIKDNSFNVTVQITESGPKGDPGEKGDKGLSAYEIWLQAGNSGTEQDFLDSLKASGFIHNQIAPSKEWDIEHTLEKFPSVSVVDSGGNLVMGDVEYISKSRLKILFNYEFSGKAYLN